MSLDFSGEHSLVTLTQVEVVGSGSIIVPQGQGVVGAIAEHDTHKEMI